MKEPIDKYKLELKNLKEESTDFKKINCPSCKSETPAAAINIQDKIAKCNNCNVVFSIEEKISHLLSKPTTKQEVIRPEGIDLFYFQNDLDITIKQPILTGETILGILIPFFAIIITLLYFFPDGDTPPPAIIPILSWVLSSFILLNFVNRRNHKIHIVVDDEMLSVYRRPKKFIKDKHVHTRDIDQLYVFKNPSHLYSIMMVVNGVNGQKQETLIKNLASLPKARFLEQEIERHLNIEDRPVPGEV